MTAERVPRYAADVQPLSGAADVGSQKLSDAAAARRISN